MGRILCLVVFILSLQLFYHFSLIFVFFLKFSHRSLGFFNTILLENLLFSESLHRERATLIFLNPLQDRLVFEQMAIYCCCKLSYWLTRNWALKSLNLCRYLLISRLVWVRQFLLWSIFFFFIFFFRLRVYFINVAV